MFGSKKVLSSLLASEHNAPSRRYSQIKGELNSGTPPNGESRSLSEVLPGEIFMELLFNFLSTFEFLPRFFDIRIA